LNTNSSSSSSSSSSDDEYTVKRLKNVKNEIKKIDQPSIIDDASSNYTLLDSNEVDNLAKVLPINKPSVLNDERSFQDEIKHISLPMTEDFVDDSTSTTTTTDVTQLHKPSIDALQTNDNNMNLDVDLSLLGNQQANQNSKEQGIKDINKQLPSSSNHNHLDLHVSTTTTQSNESLLDRYEYLNNVIINALLLITTCDEYRTNIIIIRGIDGESQVDGGLEVGHTTIRKDIFQCQGTKSVVYITLLHDYK
jgi:hypothetical protein